MKSTPSWSAKTASSTTFRMTRGWGTTLPSSSTVTSPKVSRRSSTLSIQIRTYRIAGRFRPPLESASHPSPNPLPRAPMNSRWPGSLYIRHRILSHTRSTIMASERTTQAKGLGKYAEVNGINLYYETHGSGRPLIILHGGLMSGETFGPVLPLLAERHQVIVVDLQGHGRTADIDRPIDVRLMAGDIAALIDHLSLATPDLVGYSLGGGVALQTAAQYPTKIRRLVMVSANLRPDAIYPEMRVQQGQVNASAAEFMKDTPMYQLYQRVAPRPEDFPRLLDKIGASMAKYFDFADEVRGLQVPTLIVAADADLAPASHYVEVFKLLGGGLRDGGWMGERRPEGGHALAILPGLTHYNLGDSPLFAAVTLAFLDAQPT